MEEVQGLSPCSSTRFINRSDLLAVRGESRASGGGAPHQHLLLMQAEGYAPPKHGELAQLARAHDSHS